MPPVKNPTHIVGSFEDLRHGCAEVVDLTVADSQAWSPADRPPAGTPGHWSREVVAVTNLGTLIKASYFTSADQSPGVWQRPRGLKQGEHVAKWRHA